MSPTVLQADGYRFFFYARDKDEPVHVHVEKADGRAKFWLVPVAVANRQGFADHEITAITRLIVEHYQELVDGWHAFFRTTDREGDGD